MFGRDVTAFIVAGDEAWLLQHASRGGAENSAVSSRGFLVNLLRTGKPVKTQCLRLCGSASVRVKVETCMVLSTFWKSL
jgi:hypothetical protein